MLASGEQTVQFQEMAVDCYYMPSVSSDPTKLCSVLAVYLKAVLTALLIPYHIPNFDFKNRVIIMLISLFWIQYLLLSEIISY